MEQQTAQQTHNRVLDYIKGELREGRLEVGSRLPPERTLAETLGVSRNSVREALRVLEIMGTVTSIQGAGHFITSNLDSALTESLSLMFLLRQLPFSQISQLRFALEVQALALAVEAAGEEDRQTLREIDGQLDRGGLSEEENVLLDKQLHYAIAKASGNPLFVSILQALSDVMDRFIAHLRRDIMCEPGRKEALTRAHREMVRAVLEHDPAAGRAAVAEHFRLVDERLQAGR